MLVTTRRRAEAIGMEIPPHIAGGMGETNKPITLDLPEGVPVDVILRPHESEQAGRHIALSHLSRPVASRAPQVAEAAIELAKIARLLPAVVVGPLEPRSGQQTARVGARAGPALCRGCRYSPLRGNRRAHPAASCAGTRAARRCRECAHPRLAAERRRQGASRHRGRRDRSHRAGADPAPLECFTGDLLGSLRCDCGLQLRGAIEQIAKPGSGVLLYLAQEGRGIGLVNKLRAYELQDDGFDTIDANEQLGFDADERIYAPAATMLTRMGIKRVRLMTNNPQKIAQLERYGIEVAERVAHAFPANGHNENYLRTKAERAGHLLWIGLAAPVARPQR